MSFSFKELTFLDQHARSNTFYLTGKYEVCLWPYYTVLRSFCFVDWYWRPSDCLIYPFCGTSNTSACQHAAHGTRAIGTQRKHTHRLTTLHGGHVADKSSESLQLLEYIQKLSYEGSYRDCTALWNHSFLWTTWPPPPLTPTHFQHETSLILHGKGIKFSYSKTSPLYENRDSLGKNRKKCYLQKT